MPPVEISDLFFLLAVPVVIWAAVEAVRAKAWGWTATVLLLPPVGTLAWFVAGRTHYGYGNGRDGG